MTRARAGFLAALLAAALAPAGAAAQTRPLEGEIALAYRPVAKFSERITLEGRLSADGKPIKATLHRTGSIAAAGGDLLAAMTVRAGSETPGQAGPFAKESRLTLTMTPAGEARSVEIHGAAKGGIGQIVALAAANAITLRPTVRQGQDVFDLSGLLGFASASGQGLKVVSNTLAVRAAGLSGGNLVAEPGGRVELEGKDRSYVNADVSGRCLIDVATGLARSCDLTLALDYALGGAPEKGTLRLRSSMEIKR